MRKDRTIISELQDFFLQNDAHLAINSISDVMSSLKLHKNKIGIEKADNCKFTALQYNILGYVKRFNSYETIGGLFADVTSGTKELSIVEKIWLLVMEVVAEIAEQVSADCNELMESAINGNNHLKALFEPCLKGKMAS